MIAQFAQTMTATEVQRCALTQAVADLLAAGVDPESLRTDVEQGFTLAGRTDVVLPLRPLGGGIAAQTACA